MKYQAKALISGILLFNLYTSSAAALSLKINTLREVLENVFESNSPVFKTNGLTKETLTLKSILESGSQLNRNVRTVHVLLEPKGGKPYGIVHLTRSPDKITAHRVDFLIGDEGGQSGLQKSLSLPTYGGKPLDDVTMNIIDPHTNVKDLHVRTTGVFSKNSQNPELITTDYDTIARPTNGTGTSNNTELRRQLEYSSYLKKSDREEMRLAVTLDNPRQLLLRSSSSPKMKFTHETGKYFKLPDNIEGDIVEFYPTSKGTMPASGKKMMDLLTKNPGSSADQFFNITVMGKDGKLNEYTFILDLKNPVTSNSGQESALFFKMRQPIGKNAASISRIFEEFKVTTGKFEGPTVASERTPLQMSTAPIRSYSAQ